MEKSVTSLKIIQHLAQKTEASKLYSSKDDAGYTLIELLVVIIMIGVLAVIAAPSWLTFINQRRVTAANELVMRSLQEAQNLATSTKLSHSVSFRIKDDVPEIAIYQTQTVKPNGDFEIVDPTSLNDNAWKSFEKELGLKPGQVVLGTNLGSDNTKSASLSFLGNSSVSKKITFDYLGALPPEAEINDLPLIIGVAANVGRTNTPSKATIRCVKVTTLLGALKTGRGENDCK